MHWEILRESDPEFRSEPRAYANLNQVLVRSETSRVMAFLQECNVFTAEPLSVLNVKFEPTTALPPFPHFAFRRCNSEWIQFDVGIDFLNPLTHTLLEKASKALKAIIYIACYHDSGFGYSVEDTGKVIEEYCRSEEPVYDYIPKHARRKGMVATSNHCEYFWTKSGSVNFDKKKGLCDGHEASLLRSLHCSPAAVTWRKSKQGLYKPSINFSLDDFSELFLLDVRRAE